jgi:hypothetical protein
MPEFVNWMREKSTRSKTNRAIMASIKYRHGSKTGHLSEHWAGEILPENA